MTEKTTNAAGSPVERLLGRLRPNIDIDLAH